MKKILALLLALVLVFSLCACGQSEAPPRKPPPKRLLPRRPPLKRLPPKRKPARSTMWPIW
ncbi:MAG: hypothetical protein V8T45_05810 [Oscillospiraceae bacterium]